MLLGVAEGKLDLEAGAEEACRHQFRVGCCTAASPPSSAGRRWLQDVDDLQSALPGRAVQFAVVQVDLLLLQGRAGHAPQIATVEAAVPPCAGPAPVSPPRRSLCCIHRRRHSVHPENLLGSGVDRLPQQGQTRIDGRLLAGDQPSGLGDGGRGLPGAEGVDAAILDGHGGQQETPASGARRGPCRPESAQGPRSSPRSWAQSSRPEPAAPRAATAKRAKGKSRANQRAWVRADQPPQRSRLVKLTRSGCHCSSSTRWAKRATCGLPQGART